MHVTLVVSPRKGVVLGSTISLTLVATNLCGQSVRGATIGVPVPYGTQYVRDTLYHDAVRTPGDEFFGEGCEIAELVPGARTAFLWKLRVEDRDEPIRIVPQVFAGVTSVSGTDPVEVTRAAGLSDLAISYREFENAARAYFEQIFGRPAPASLHQALSACALACALDAQSQDHLLEAQAQTLHRLARAVHGHHVTGVEPNFLLELRGLRDARAAAATIEALRAFAALDAAAGNLATDDRVRYPVSLS